jgi:hypothetical protein
MPKMLLSGGDFLFYSKQNKDLLDLVTTDYDICILAGVGMYLNMPPAEAGTRYWEICKREGMDI